MEDVFITGILAQYIGIRPEDNVGFSYIERLATACFYDQTISSHHLSINEMKDMFKKVKKKQSKCAINEKKFLQTYGSGQCTWEPPK